MKIIPCIFFIASFSTQAFEANNADDYSSAQAARQNIIVDNLMHQQGTTEIHAYEFDFNTISVVRVTPSGEQRTFIDLGSSIFTPFATFKGKQIDRFIQYDWRNLNTYIGEDRNNAKSALLIRFLNR